VENDGLEIVTFCARIVSNSIRL